MGAYLGEKPKTAKVTVYYSDNEIVSREVKLSLSNEQWSQLVALMDRKEKESLLPVEETLQKLPMLTGLEWSMEKPVKLENQKNRSFRGWLWEAIRKLLHYRKKSE